MARRNASARPSEGSALRFSNVEVASRVAAFDHRPVRHEQRAAAGIEERAGESRQRFRPRLVAGNRVAGRQHHPVGIELELRHLARGEQAIVKRTWLRRRRGLTLSGGGDHLREGLVHDPEYRQFGPVSQRPEPQTSGNVARRNGSPLTNDVPGAGERTTGAADEDGRRPAVGGHLDRWVPHHHQYIAGDPRSVTFFCRTVGAPSFS